MSASGTSVQGARASASRPISPPSGCPTRIGDIPGGKADAAELFRLMGQDKKVRDGKLTFILVRGIGEAFVERDVAPDRVLGFLAQAITA